MEIQTKAKALRQFPVSLNLNGNYQDQLICFVFEIFLAMSMERLTNPNATRGMSTPDAQTVVSKYCVLLEGNGFLEQELMPGPKQEVHKNSPELRIMLEARNASKDIGILSKDSRAVKFPLARHGTM